MKNKKAFSPIILIVSIISILVIGVVGFILYQNMYSPKQISKSDNKTVDMNNDDFDNNYDKVNNSVLALSWRASNRANANSVLKAAEAYRSTNEHYPKPISDENEMRNNLYTEGFLLPEGFVVVGQYSGQGDQNPKLKFPKNGSTSYILYVTNNDDYTKSDGVCVFYWDAKNGKPDFVLGGIATSAEFGKAPYSNSGDYKCS